VNVCDVSPCVSVERDSVGGRALPCPQQRRSEGSWRQEHVQSCACRRGWLCGAHSEVGKDGPGPGYANESRTCVRSFSNSFGLG